MMYKHFIGSDMYISELAIQMYVFLSIYKGFSNLVICCGSELL